MIHHVADTPLQTWLVQRCLRIVRFTRFLGVRSGDSWGRGTMSDCGMVRRAQLEGWDGIGKVGTFKGTLESHVDWIQFASLLKSEYI